MTVQKWSFPQAEIHQLVSGVAYPSGMANGMIVDVMQSLGRLGRYLLLDGKNGAITVRFNVCQKTFERQENDNPWIPEAAFYTKPLETDEIELERNNITVTSGVALEVDDIPIKDFKIVSCADQTRIIFK